MRATYLRMFLCGILAQAGFTSCLDPMTAAFVLTNPPADEKNLNLLTRGVPRTQIHKEFGHPAGTYTDRETGRLHDVFRFRQGFSKGKQAGLLAGNLAMSTLGVGLTQPGKSMAINVEYDEQERVLSYRPVQ